MTNSDIADVFKLLSVLMDLHGKNSFKAKSYANASFQIDKFSKELSEMDLEEISSQRGIGDAIAEKIQILLNEKSLPLLDELMAKTPKGVLEILQIKGLGPKKVRVIWKEMGIESIGELLYACNENRLIKTKGFGEKTQESVIKAIKFLQASQGKYLYAEIEQEANDIVEFLKKELKTEFVSLTGTIRRKCEVLEKIEILAGISNLTGFENLPGLLVESKEENFWKCKTAIGTPLILYFSTKENFQWDLFKTTASKNHLKDILALNGNIELVSVSDEQEIYSKLNLQFIFPEMREGGGEIELAKKNKIPDLIELKDIKGIIHCHSKYSDGKNSLEEMAVHCKNLGYEYLGISDHSKTAVYASGLKEEDILRQHEEIEKLNEKLKPFKIFKGIESDILGDGSLDYEENILQKFDFVIASVHSNLQMTQEKAMERLLKAIENPYTTILGHPTGRLLLSREGYPLDHKIIIDACAKNNVIIELNANPHRLDLDWRWIEYALSKNVKISINPDAHNLNGIQDILFGIFAARKGGLSKDMTVNALLKNEITELFSKKNLILQKIKTQNYE